MRLEALALALLVTTPVLVGCLGGGDDLETAELGQGELPPESVLAEPQVVVAHIDTGVNPYHEAFRDTSPLAHVHPCRYIEGYPCDVPALELTLDAGSWEEAVEADQEVWANVTEGQLYWIPGTRIVGAQSFGPGGTRTGVSEDTPILDDHGHGTMTGSRSVGEGSSLAPEARLVTIEGLSAEAVRWVADTGWIDIQTNSWLSLLPAPANRAPVEDTAAAFAYAAERMVTVAASGNGAAFVTGFAPTPTYLLSTAAPGVLLVGAHDNGYVTQWSGSPPHVVADGFRPLAAVYDSLDEIYGHAFSCCTSASAPYAAGAAAAIVLEARELLGDSTEGPRDGVLAQGDAGLVAEGPLADGDLTLDELRQILTRTAQPRPVATVHDGQVHWAAEPATPDDPSAPGANAYCPGCWSAPVKWEALPEEAPAYPYVGYGAVNLFSAANASAVLTGQMPLPERSTADTLYEVDQMVRDPLYPEGESR